MKKSIISLVASLILTVPMTLTLHAQDKAMFKPIADSIQIYLKPSAKVGGKVAIESVTALKKKRLIIAFNQALGEYPVRAEQVEAIYSIAHKLMPQEYQNYKLFLKCNGTGIEDFVPPVYDPSKEKAAARKEKHDKKHHVANNLIYRASKPYAVNHGLQDKHIALWQSHGYYYEQKLLRWEWQRARIFQTVEDLYTQSYVLPYLVPMLENSGAVVMLPRERDVQLNEVIVDNDMANTGFSEMNGDSTWQSSQIPGFANTKESYTQGENPFTLGTARVISFGKKGESAGAKYYPTIPERGEYAVYVSYQSYPNSTERAIYTVHHKGGDTKFFVNQKMGGGTWIYLGTFLFEKGQNPDGYVDLFNVSSDKNEVLSADAVKFGGGKGNIARKPAEAGSQTNVPSSSSDVAKTIKMPKDITPETSGYPRFTEGARYWLQWAGFNDTIYSANAGSNDYNDDYMSRGRWVNVLSGGSVKNPEENGYKIPLDLSFAFHTDAGTTLNDSIIGTLSIYTRLSNGDAVFPTGTQRITNRYLADLVQTQIVNDVRTLYEPIWERRGLWDRSYSESRSPKVPSMLLELLSHQNFADMRYGLDPNFRFTISRAIYKGILKYLNVTQNKQYVVQPLPVKCFSADVTDNKVTLKWQPVNDTLEPTAKPTKYIVYKRVGDGGFDNGRISESNSFSEKIEKDRIYSYKITAVNEGGESFSSEILSVYISSQEKGKVLIVNCFDRVSAPASYATIDTTRGGFADYLDHGVPYLRDISYIGSQYEYRREIPWMDDDSPGFGASYADYETKVIAGNSFDYPYVHGKALAALGYSFVSSSRDAVTGGVISPANYQVVDLIMGKQLQCRMGRDIMPVNYTVFPKSLQRIIADYAGKGGKIIVSGANIATDIWDSIEMDKESMDFAEGILKYKWRTNFASKTGEVKAVQSPYNFKGKYSFFTEPNEISYCVETPDGLEPVGENSWTIFRYSDNNISAGVAYKGVYSSVALGFPIESLKSDEQIQNIFNNIFNFFEK
ncbi:MAG: xanthan lyase [Bacteroidales bacterium]|nr:xanthan lyase [Bacteroidales bacterium]